MVRHYPTRHSATELEAVRLEALERHMIMYQRGLVPPHYPVPAKYNHIDRIVYGLGYRDAIKCFVNYPFVGSEWYE